MGVHRDAAPVIADGQGTVGFQPDLDDAGMSGDRLVHGVVENFGKEVVQRPLVRAPDIHARALADGLQALEDLDVLGGIVAAGSGGPGRCRARDSRLLRGVARRRVIE